MANLINLEQVSKTYGLKTLLDGVSLGVQSGDRIGIVGVNGGGKTTLLEVLTGIEPPDAGRVSHTSDLRMAVVTQRFDLPDELTIAQVIIEPLELETYENGFRVRMDQRPQSVDYQTLPFPGFPTDLQPMAIGISAIADGTTVITENVFESRFRFVDEMLRLGADAQVDGHHVVVRGKERLSSTHVWSSDIRAGAGLVLSALCADETTTVHDVFHIDRGYPNFVENLQRLGATIERTQEEELF